MPDDLYDHDALAWSEQQAALLRRVARGERVNGVDWEHVVEEIEDVGLSELNSVRSFLLQLLIHLHKLTIWPESDAADHWRIEIARFQAEAQSRFTPSMRQRIDVAAVYKRSLRAIRSRRVDADSPIELPQQCPFSLEDLLTGEVSALLERLPAGQ